MLLVRKNYHPVVNDLINDFMKNDWFETLNNFPMVHQPKSNISETENGFNIEMLVPGFKKEDIKLSIEENLLTVSVERESKIDEKTENQIYKEFKIENFKRSFSISKQIDVENIKANFEDGILKIEIPKKEAVETKKLIEVK